MRSPRPGICTVEQLCAASKAALRKVWNGIEGERWYAKLRGEVVYAPPTNKSTIGHQHVLPPEARTDQAALAVLHKLLQKAGLRLRSYGYMAGGLQLEIKYVDGARWNQQLRFDPTWDMVQLTRVLARLWSNRPKSTPKPLMVGVTLVDLRERGGYTPSLFGEDLRRDRLNEVVDRLNARFGGNTLYFGGAQPALDSAPMRIAFNHIPDPKLED